MQSIAIIGSGISGLTCAWFLQHEHAVTVFEADDHIGGHANTVSVDEDGTRLPIDTGFMVFNHVTYPNLLRLFQVLAVPTQRTDMSFSVQHRGRGTEYAGSSLNHLFAQRSNLLRPAFYRMLRQVDRFNREAVDALADGSAQNLSLAEYVERRGYGHDFLELYLLPMSSAVWSTPPAVMLRFPAAALLQFFHNHGFLGLHTQHPWWTVTGGSREYVERMCRSFRDRIHLRTPVQAVRRVFDGVEVHTASAVQRFDAVIFACHPPTALEILGVGATAPERSLLRAFRYQANVATLHSDARVMPTRRLAWSSWNYRLEVPAGDADELIPSTHYWMNRLQRVSERRNYFVSIDNVAPAEPREAIRTIAYEHPQFDLAARRMQGAVPALNALGHGTTRTYFVGAWQGYGFHEDGCASAVALCTTLLGRDPWRQPTLVEVA